MDRDLRLVLSLLKEIEHALPLTQDWRKGLSGVERSAVAGFKRALKRARSDPWKMHFGIQEDLGLEAYELEAYMKDYLLLFACLRSESYVSRPVREQLVQGIFSLK